MPTDSASKAVPARQRILDAAGELFRRNGYAATGVKAILKASSTPYGSLYHHFPEGKQQVGVEVLRTSGETYRQLVDDSFSDVDDLAEATRRFFAGAADLLEQTDYADACPIATIALEVANSDEGMRVAASEAFESWIETLAAALRERGVPAADARRAAVQVFCLIEGAFVLARSTRTVQPLEAAGTAAVDSVRAALALTGAGKRGKRRSSPKR